MSETLQIQAKADHVDQWLALKNAYVTKRGSDPGRNRKAVPRTTNSDVAQLASWWDNELRRALLRAPFARDNAPASRKRWTASKATLDRQLDHADRAAVYPANEWFWNETRRLAIYLESRKAVPSSTELLLESFQETLAEHAETTRGLGKSAADAATRLGAALRAKLGTGALIAAGLLGTAIVVPPIIRAIRDK